MTAQEHIAKLESLLDRIRRKASEPRSAAVRAPVVAAPPALEELPPYSGSPATARAEPGPPPILSIPTPAAGTPAVSASAAAPAELEELDMMDAEIVEIEAAPAGRSVPPDDLDGLLDSSVDEPVPESAPRAAQALADSADLEPPMKTPPPESGRQAVAPVPPTPAVTYRAEAEEADISGGNDVDSLLEADLSGGPISKAPPGVPTMEQLGEIVSLEGEDAPAAELELLEPPPEKKAPQDELELSLPQREFQGGYDAALAPPPGAAADLERHRGDVSPPALGAAPIIAASPIGESVPPLSMPNIAAPASLEEPPMPMSAMPPTELATAKPLTVARPAADAPYVAEVVTAKAAKLPETFLELLDASLRL